MKTIKDYIKKNPEPARGRFGINPHDPWSAKYGVAEDLTTVQKSQGDSRSKIAHSPTLQRANELEKSASFYKIKTPQGTMHRKESNQNTSLTPEEVEMNEAKKRMSGADKWRQASYDREKAHKEFMKSIAHLPDSEQTKIMMDKIKADRASVHKEDMNPNSPKAKEVGKELKNISNRQSFGFSKEEVRGELKKIRSKEENMYDKEIESFNKKVKNIKAEETYMDAKAATPAPMSPGEGISEKMTTAQRVMMLNKKKLKEDLYDHRVADKSVATYGKKPKMDTPDMDKNVGENKPSAAVIMSGGTTQTGSKRDTIEIDPMMRNRPGQPDAMKKQSNKKDK